MKLIIYNIENARSGNNGERTFRINKETGLITLSREAARQYNLKEGDRIMFANDEENKKSWFFCKTTDEAGFLLKNNKGVFQFRNTFVADMLLSSLKIGKSAVFFIEKEPENMGGTDYYQLITSKPMEVDKVRVFKKTK